MRPLPTSTEVWRAYDAIEVRLSAPLTERMLDLAGVGAGMRVLDVASGRGEPAIPAARRVGRTGQVVGVEPSEDVLQLARERAAREGVTNLELRLGDAETLPGVPGASFDVVTLRWGLMYFAEPVKALIHAARALKPDGLLVAALWAGPEEVPYHTLPRRVLERYRSVPPVDFAAPGPFRYGEIQVILRDFSAAGLSVEHLEDMDVPVMESTNAAEVIAWCRAFGLTRLLNDLPESDQLAWERDLAAELERRRRDGVIQLGGTTHIALARKTEP